MLERIRQNVRHPLIQVLLGLIILVFALFFGWSMRGAGQASFAATVNGENISVEEYQDSYRRLIDFYQQTTQNQLTRDQLEQLGLPQRALELIIDRTLMAQEADRLGFSATDDELSAAVKALPVFRDEENRFTQDRYQRVLAAQGLSSGQFEMAKRQEIILNKVEQSFRDSAVVTDEDVEAEFQARNVKITSDYVAFEPSVFSAEAEITDEMLADYHAAEGESFRTQEQRAARYAFFPVEEFSAQVEISEEALLNEYRVRAYQFLEEEVITPRHILISADTATGEKDWDQALAQAQKLKAELDEGADFAAMARSQSADPGSRDQGGELGPIGRGKLVPEFENAAFALPMGKVSEPVRTQFGYHLILVDARVPERQKPLEEVRDELTALLRLEKGRELAQDAADNLLMDLEDKTTDWATIGEAREVTTSALVTALQSDSSFPQVEGFQQALFRIDPKAEGEFIETLAGAYLFSVAEQVEAAIPPLDEIRTEVEARLREREGKRLAQEAAEGFAALCVEQGWEAGLEESNLSAKTTEVFSEKGGNLPGLGYSTEAKEALFTIEQAGTAAPNAYEISSNFYALHLATREEPDMAQLEVERETLRQELLPTKREAAYTEQMEILRSKAEIERNELLFQ